MKRRFVSGYGLIFLPVLLVMGCGSDPETIPDTTPPLAPQLNGAIKEVGTVGVSWIANTEPDLDGYYIYVSENGIIRQANPLPVRGTSTVIDVNNTSGSVQVWMTAIDFSGNESSASTSAWASDDVPSPQTHYVSPGDPQQF